MSPPAPPLESLRTQDARLSPYGDYPAILDDEEFRAPIGAVLRG